MRKPYSASDDDVKHYVLPELTGNIVGLRDDVVRPQTVEEIEALQKQAYEEAKKAGYAEGLKNGLQEMQVKANQLQAVFNFLKNPIEEMDLQVEYQLAELSMAIAKQLLRKESSVDEKHISTLIHESLEFLPVKAKNISVRLNPADILLLNKADIDTNEQSWTCISDAGVTAGGCVIESDTSHVDASMERRVEQLVEQLGLKTSAGDGDVTE
jgi:flagellar assembly protein FliH